MSLKEKMSHRAEKFTIAEVEDGKAYYSPYKGAFVTIDTCAVYQNDGEFENSTEEWCRELHGELVPYIKLMFETYKGFIYLFSRRYCSYTIEGLDVLMNENGFDAVFIDEEGFYFCGNHVENYYMSASEVYDEENIFFCSEDYGDDCLGYHDSYYVHDGVLYSLHELTESEI